MAKIKDEYGFEYDNVFSDDYKAPSLVEIAKTIDFEKEEKIWWKKTFKGLEKTSKR